MCQIINKRAAEVEWLQADCDELAYVKNQIHNIPSADCSVQKWFGDDAKFIAANISL